MPILQFPFVESLLVRDNFALLPLIPIRLRNGEKFYDVKAIVDTGASNSFIDNVFVKALEVTHFVGTMVSVGIGGTEIKEVCELDLSIADRCETFKVRMAISDLQHPSINAILGRDILNLFKNVTYSHEHSCVIIEL